MRRLAPFAVLAAVFVTPACRTPTQITLEISSTDICPSTTNLLISVRGTTSGVASTAMTPDARITGCPTGAAYTLAFAPPAAKDAPLDLLVIAARGKDPDTCVASPPDSACLWLRRAVRFEAHTQRQVTMTMSSRCWGIPCDEGSTCSPVTGRCVAKTEDERTPEDGGSDAPLYPVCASSACAATDAEHVVAEKASLLAAGADRLVWLTSGALYACTVPGCADRVKLVQETAPGISSLAVDATRVLYTIPDDLWSCGLTGCFASPQRVATLAGLAEVVIAKRTLAVTNRTSVLTCQGTPCDPKAIDARTSQRRIAALAADDSNAYWLSEDWTTGLFEIEGVAAAGNEKRESRVIFKNIPRAVGLAVSGGSLVWAQQDPAVAGYNIVACDKRGCAIPSPVGKSTARPIAIVADDGTAYWATGGSVYACPLAGCPGGPLVVHTNNNEVTALSTDATHVYWLIRALPGGTTGDEGIWRRPRCCPPVP